MTKKLVIENGVEELIDMTPEEETQFAKDKDNSETEATNFANSLTEKADLKASAKAKLIAGEALTEEEANTIVL